MPYCRGSPEWIGSKKEENTMMVEPQKLENIAFAIHQQAGLLRRAGRISEANGMERRAAELRTLIAARQSGNMIEYQRQAA